MLDYQKQWEFLAKAVAEEKIFNAYLFYGGDFVEEIALDFVEAINSTERDIKKLIAKNFAKEANKLIGNILFVEPLAQDSKGNEKKGNEITISQVRELSAFCSLTSLNNAYKAVIIRQAHCLNTDAQDAFLKILEEPKGNVVFLLLSNQPDRLLPTVLSRCCRIFFPSRIDLEINDSKAEIFQKIRKGNLAQRFAYAQTILASEEKAEQYQGLKKELSDWIVYLRTCLFSEKYGADYPKADCLRAMAAAQKALYLLENTNTNQKLNIENFLIEL